MTVRTTPENITELADDEIFVFGSNLLGIHGAGAARVACELFGAELGVGEGLTGRCYAFPTVSGPTGSPATRQLTHERLQQARNLLFTTARNLPSAVFLLTKVGCGLAGYPEEYMAGLFAESLVNIIKPEGW
jgi:hypothetical protein